jgi:2-dehydropantoate 2-reductase
VAKTTSIPSHVLPLSKARFNAASALSTTVVLAAIDAEAVDDVGTRIWQKFVFLTAFSGVTSATRQPIGPLLANIQARALLLDLMREVVSLGRAIGVSLEEDYAEDSLQFCRTLPSAIASSMHNDLERGTRLELDWLSGWIQEKVASMRVITPMDRAIARVLSVYSEGGP